MVARWSHDGRKMVARWSQDGRKIVARWSNDGQTMVARCFENIQAGKELGKFFDTFHSKYF
jgi:hypothetical protein